MRQSLITLGFFVGILSLPIAVTLFGESVAQAQRSQAASVQTVSNSAATEAVEAGFVGPVWLEAIAKQ